MTNTRQDRQQVMQPFFFGVSRPGFESHLPTSVALYPIRPLKRSLRGYTAFLNMLFYDLTQVKDFQVFATASPVAALCIIRKIAPVDDKPK